MSKRGTPRAAEAAALALVLGIALLAGRSLLEAGFYDAHDNLLNLHRLSQMERCFADGQIPCRWAPDLAFGFGQPLFNYYPPLPSYVGFALTRIGLSELQAVKASMMLALLGGAGSMFVLARLFFGRPASVVAAALYTWAPYRAIDVYVRGALAEAVGLALLPLVFWSAARTLRGVDGPHRLAGAVGFALAWAALALSHLLVIAMAAPFYLAWCAAWIARERPPREGLARFAAAHVGAAGLAAFFWLPAVWERNLVQLDALTTLYPWNRVTNNFLAFDQLVLGTRDWGYGAFGAADGMSLYVGGLQWLAAGVGVAALAWHVRQAPPTERAGRSPEAVAGVLMASTALVSLAMTLPLSRVLWSLPGLAFLQFPWRFLGVAALGLAFVAAPAVEALRERPALARAAAALVAGLAVATGWSVFRPAALHDVSSRTLLTEGQLARNRHGAFDYVPRDVDLAALADASRVRDPEPARVVEGRATLEVESRGSRHLELAANVAPDADAVVRLHAFSFPDWRVQLDGEPVSQESAADPLGRIHVRVPAGRHRVRAELASTPVRSVANTVSLATTAGGALWLALRARRGTRGTS